MEVGVISGLFLLLDFKPYGLLTPVGSDLESIKAEDQYKLFCKLHLATMRNKPADKKGSLVGELIRDKKT